MAYQTSGNWGPLAPWRSTLDTTFSDLWDDLGGAAARFTSPWNVGRAFPAVNVWEEDDTLYAEAEIPGLKSEDLDISVVGSELTLKGQRRAVNGEGKQHRRERGTGAFTRVLRLPAEIDGSKVNASLKNGVLLLTLPKHEKAKPRKIKVSAK